jgi:molybdenum cofactor cytidylyltransferase
MSELVPLILAAGQSRRFDGDKLLSPLTLAGEEKPLLVHTLAPWLAVFEQVSLVVRSEHAAILSLLQRHKLKTFVRLLVAHDADKGMGHSLAAGVAATREASAWLVGLADMPGLDTDTLKQSATYLAQGQALTVPYYQGRQGHPVGFDRRYRDELLQLEGDRGARMILQRDQHKIQAVAAGPGAVMDIDSRQDRVIFTKQFQ